MPLPPPLRGHDEIAEVTMLQDRAGLFTGLGAGVGLMWTAARSALRSLFERLLF